MADLSVSALATSIIKPLATQLALPQVMSWWGARDDLKKLKESIEMIQARVRDAEQTQEAEINDHTKLWLERLRRVLRQAYDLFEELKSIDLQKQQMEGSMLAKIRFFFSWYGPLCLTIKAAHEIKSINKELDTIKGDMDCVRPNNLPSVEHPMARVIKKRETYAYLRDEEKEQVIGRENDKEKIIEMLFDPKYDNQKITVIPTVGSGGVGKTTLAKLVFNDESVEQHFDLTTWAYVPEKDENTLIKTKIYHAFTDKIYHDESLQTIGNRIRSSIKNKKYLLVLDDLWIERLDINKFLGLLELGEHGSKVIVTTRSDVVAAQFRSIPAAYKLDILTVEESWELFKKLAFKPGWESGNLSEIGKRIVNMCGNLPLAITVVGGTLKSKHTPHEWLQVEKDLSAARLEGTEEMKAILKLSYDYLPLESQPCFAYCSLFPKGYEFEKDDLVHLWMAQGYVESDNGDGFFRGLVDRNLLQASWYFYLRDVQIYKMHDLLHDMAQEVAVDKTLVYEPPKQIHDRLVHVYINGSTYPSSMKHAKGLQSLLHITYDEELFPETTSLRALSMKDFTCEKLPYTIGTLINLRYLNLGMNDIECLPDSITGLVNLQTLNLEECSRLKELPRDFVILSNLRHLLLPYDAHFGIRHLLLPSNRMYDMPPRFGELTSLQQLNWFLVGENNGIDSLRAENIRGKMYIEFHKWHTRDAIKEAQRATLKDSCGLTDLKLNLNFEKEEETPDVGEMNEMLKSLQFPPYLKDLRVFHYKGDELPSGWASLHHLEYIKLHRCEKCTVLPNLSGLPHLKTLVLEVLDDLEYVEGGTATRNMCFFPSLEVLELLGCKNLKGWMRASEDDGQQRQLVFPCLLKMEVFHCHMLMSMPLAPKLESLRVARVYQNMFESNVRPNNDDQEAASSSSAPPSSSTLFTSLKELHASLVDDLMLSSILSSSLYSLRSLRIKYCFMLENIGERLQGFSSLRVLDLRGLPRVKTLNSFSSIGCVTTLQELNLEDMSDLTEIPEEVGNFSLLRDLRIKYCPKVMSLPSSILRLPKLQELYITKMENLTELPGENGKGKLLQLRHLQVEDCPKLKSLPIIQCLASLDKLIIEKCPELKSLPTSIGGLTLKTLLIRHCPELAEKMLPGGEDWHLIKHVRIVFIYGDGVRHITYLGEEYASGESLDS